MRSLFSPLLLTPALLFGVEQFAIGQSTPVWSPDPFRPAAGAGFSNSLSNGEMPRGVVGSSVGQANPLRPNQALRSNQDVSIASQQKTSDSVVTNQGAVTKPAEVVRWRKVDAAASSSGVASSKSLAEAFRRSQAPQMPKGPEASRLEVRPDLFHEDSAVSQVQFQQPVTLPQSSSTRSSLLIKQPQEPAPPPNLVLPNIAPPSLPSEPLALPPNVPKELVEPPSLNLEPVVPPNANEELVVPPTANSEKVAPPAANSLPSLNERTLPNPFPRKEQELVPQARPGVPPAELRSPSDRNLREPARLDDDLPPTPPKRAEQSVANCDLVRNFAAGTDIRNVQVNSSPEYVKTKQSMDKANDNSKKEFVEKTPYRTWRGISGEQIAEGKLVDLVYGTVVIEQKDGSRLSYLQRQLSDSDQVFVAESWGIPVTCSLGDQGFAPRAFVESTVTWKASGACNKPLYFEDVDLERYGHEWGPVVQPAISTVRFFGDLAVLPYKMGIHPPNECQHPLGYHRPGSCAPWGVRPIPISARGAVTQAAFVTGTVFALP